MFDYEFDYEEEKWWYPQLSTSDEYCDKIRDDNLKDLFLDNEEISRKYNDGRKYVTKWKDLDDAYAQFEALADAYFRLKEEKEHNDLCFLSEQE